MNMAIIYSKPQNNKILVFLSMLSVHFFVHICECYFSAQFHLEPVIKTVWWYYMFIHNNRMDFTEAIILHHFC